MPFTKIVTERLALRQLVANDAQEIFEYRSRPEVSREAGGSEETTADSSPVGPPEKAQTLVSGRFR